MKVLVVLAVLGVCSALPFLQDTPEVIAEKQRFFQLYNAAAAAAAAASPDNSIAPQQAQQPAHRRSHPVQVTQTTLGWTGPVAATVPAGVNGNFAPVSETADVQAATRVFQQAYQDALRATAPHRLAQVAPRHIPAPAPQFNSVWTGPVAATIPAGLPGAGTQVRNTPEVEAAIAEFTRSYNAAVRSTTGFQPAAASHRAAHPSVSNHRFSAPTFNAAPVAPQRWTGPFAATIPAGLPGSSVVGDTAEVAAAKASFQRAFQQQLAFTG